MSLISDALKKAQRQRNEGVEPADSAAADTGAAPAPRIARREKPAGFRSQIMMAALGGLAVLIVALAAGGFWLWRSDHKREAPPPKTEIAAVHAPAPAAVTPAAASTPMQPPPAAAESKPGPTPVVAQEKPSSAPAVAANPGAGQFTLPLGPAAAPTATASASPTTPAVSGPVVAVASKPTTRPKPSVHMITIIENLRVEGIRAAGSDSKVLMNDRVYRLNDVVDHELGFRLTGVTEKALTFEDDQGATYTRNF